MTVDERAKCEAVARELFPNEEPMRGNCPEGCGPCKEQEQEWNDTLWRVYNALMKAELI